MDRTRGSSARRSAGLTKRALGAMTAVALAGITPVWGASLSSAAAGPEARASAATPASEEQRVAAAIEDTLQKHAPELHRCFERALADSIDVGGTVEISVDVGDGGKVSSAKIESRGSAVPGPLAACVGESAKTWTIAAIEPGASLVLPFTFASHGAQFSVKAADVPDRGPAAPKGRGGVQGQAPFKVKVLADDANLRVQEASVTLLTVGPANRVAMHRHPRSSKVLYVIKGNARVLGPPGAAPVTLREGMAMFLPPGYPHVIENMGRQIPVTMLQVFAPPGPERVYREPNDPEARANFEVIRDASKIKLDPAVKPVVVTASETKPLPFLGGKVTARILFDEATTGSNALAFDFVEFAPGTDAPRHSHDASAELLYVLSGGGTLTVGSEAVPFGAEELLYIPRGQPHAAKFSGNDKTFALQIYAPAGPEQRFKAPATPAVPPKPGGAK